MADVSEQKVVECYNRLGSLESPFKERLAGALKGYYVRTGKWDVKPKQEKQWTKVQKLKKILGER